MRGKPKSTDYSCSMILDALEKQFSIYKLSFDRQTKKLKKDRAQS